jgi:CheY-like chemotaxis protein
MNKRVLVIDDERMNLLLFKGMLKNFDITLTTAISGSEGIDYHKENKFDLILTDFNMPLMNGVQTLNILREFDNSINTYTPIFLITAVDNKSISEWKEFSFDEVLFKPIDIELLKTSINQYLFPNQ